MPMIYTFQWNERSGEFWAFYYKGMNKYHISPSGVQNLRKFEDIHSCILLFLNIFSKYLSNQVLS